MKQDILSGNYTFKNKTIDRRVEPIVSVLPPSLLIKSINDFGALSSAEKDSGLRFKDA